MSSRSVRLRSFYLLTIILLLFFILTFTAAADRLTVHFIDVGQGDSILIQKQDINILIDGGDRFNWVAERLISYLSNQGVEKVDAIIATHPHADHIGGLPAVIETFDVGRVYDSGKIHTTQTFENFLLLIYEKDIPYYTPRRGDKINVGELELSVLHPSDDIEEYSLNNASVVTSLKYGEVTFLFTGDAEREAEEEMLATDQDLQARVLKVGHHGSSTSSTDAFLDSVKPKIAVIQCGEDNPFGHPHTEVLEALESRDVDIYRTDKHGNVVVTTDGVNIWTEVSREAEPRAPPDTEDTADLININTASSNELQELSGIGPAIAERIIDYREEHGPFDRIEDIMQVSGIAEGRFKQIKNQIRVSE